MNRTRKVTFSLVAALALLASSVLSGCGRSESSAPPAKITPVFLISIDTLRSDHLPLYGYTAGSTPHIDRFRQDAVLFRNAFSNVPLTLPSHSSILTGELPPVHGVRDNIGYSLKSSSVTLQDILRQSGYRTGAAVSSFVLRHETGLDSGFEFYDDAMTVSASETVSSWQRNGDLTRQTLQSWMDGLDTTRVFGFLHLYEPHMPYEPPAEFAHFENPYDGEIAYADAIVGRFLDHLRERGLYDKALIVLLSDHGEGLGEHGEQEHGVFLYRESIQVPLLIKLPRNQHAGEENDRVASLTDVTPTVLAALGIPPTPAMNGRDLFAATSATPRPVYSESYYPRLHYGWSELLSMTGGRYHLIEAPRVELYDRTTDPAERTNLAESQRRELASLRSDLRTITSDHPFEEPRLADPEDAKKLEALGYLGSFTPSTDGARPDPKDEITLLDRFGRANHSFQMGANDAAIAAATEIVSEHPAFLQGWGLLSAAYRSKGDLPHALAALEEQMRRSPGNPQTALALASISLDMHHYDEAMTYAELVVSYAPSLAYEMMANIELSRKHLDAAEQQARRAAEASPLRVQPLMILSQIEQARGNATSELALLDQVRIRVAEQHLPPIPDLELRRGDALLHLRRAADAEAAFRAETDSFPKSRRAWANLAIVIGAQGRPEEAKRVLDRAIEANPDATMKGIAREVMEVIQGQPPGPK